MQTTSIGSQYEHDTSTSVDRWTRHYGICCCLVRLQNGYRDMFRPIASFLIMGGGSFSSDFGPFLGFENWSSQWLSSGNLELQNNNDWWRYFVVKARIYTTSLLDFINHRWTIFKMLALEQSAEKWPFSAGGRPTAPTPLPWLWTWC